MSSEPQTAPPAWSDERVELVIGNLLRYGVIVSALVVLTGGILYLTEKGREPVPDYRAFHEGTILTPAAILHDALNFRSEGVTELGLLLLIATPVARVLFSVFAFARQRDALYVVVTLIVLAVLLYSLFSGQVSE
jgi:uncharacterized membrane protein